MKVKKARSSLPYALPVLAAILFFLCSCSAHTETARREERGTLTVAIVSDIHYTGERHYAYTGSFAAANDASGSGKQVELLPALLDAFVDEMLALRPDVLLITGDNAFNGALVSHEALIEKLLPLRENGIIVLTLPGNHDINTNALVFPDGEVHEAVSPSPEQFVALYTDFGYGAAISRDAQSLSYVFDTGRGVRFFMLDTNFRYGAVYGRIGDGTLKWLKQELQASRAAGDRAVVAGHHNLLAHNPLFTFTHTIDNGDSLCKLLSDNGVSLFLSGHLHPQSIALQDGMTDIATESFAVYPHRYGLLTLDGDSWRYEAQRLDVERWAGSDGSGDERLLHYDEYGSAFLYNSTYRQLKDELGAIDDEALREEICDRVAQANVNYFLGDPSPALDSELIDTLVAAGLGFWSGYLSTVTDLPASLYAEGYFSQ